MSTWCTASMRPSLSTTTSSLSMASRASRSPERGRQRFGPLYGDGPGGSTEAQLDMLRPRRFPAIRGASNVLPYVHIDDAAAAIGAPRPLQLPEWHFRRLAGSYATGFSLANLPVSNAKARAELLWEPAYPTVAAGAKTLA